MQGTVRLPANISRGRGNRSVQGRPSDMTHSVNSTYLNVFLPFWWEPVLLRGRLEEADAAKVVKGLLR